MLDAAHGCAEDHAVAKVSYQRPHGRQQSAHLAAEDAATNHRHDDDLLHEPQRDARFDAKGNWIAPMVAPDRVVASEQAAAAISECLEGLPPLYREVFQLRQVEELSAADVSKIVGRTVTHVGVLFHRARLRLRDCLDGKGWGANS